MNTQNHLSEISMLNPRSICQWPGQFRCPVLGLCLSPKEVLFILKKSSYNIKGLSAYDMHTILVHKIHDDQRLANRLDTFLKKKYRKAFAYYAPMDEACFLKHWRKRQNDDGDICDIFYCAVSMSNMNEETLKKIYGDLHMTSHQAMKELINERKTVNCWASANQKISCLFRKEKKRSVHLRMQNKILKEKNRALKRLVDNVNNYNSEKNEHDLLKKAYEKEQALKEKLHRFMEETHRLEREKRKLEIAHFDLKNKSDDLKKELDELIKTLPKCFSCSEDAFTDVNDISFQCPNKVLIVGGITRLEHQYRQLIESIGGSFEYHDGYLKTGKKKLEDKVRRCDMVLCPVNCNSHGACGLVKMLGKRYNKPVKMLPKASLSTISKALMTVGDSITRLN